MKVKQLTVFLENRKGRLYEVMEILKEVDVNVLAACIAETSDFGLVRMLVSDPEKAKDVLKEKGIMARLNEIICVLIPHEAGSLEKLLKVMSDEEINIKYMYGISTEQNEAAIALKTDDIQKTVDLFRSLGLKGFC